MKNQRALRYGVGDQQFLERFIWFDNEARYGRYPNATKLADLFELFTKTAHRSIDYPMKQRL